MKVIQLLTFSINNIDFYFTDAGSDYYYDQSQYKAGFWEGIKSFEQRSAPAINEHSINLSDDDLSITITLYSGKWQWQPLKIRWLILNENNQIIDDFIVLQSAITMHDTDDESRQLTLRVQENHTLELATGHRTTSASQHLINSTDDCFELIPFLDGITLAWGKDGNGVVKDIIAENGYILSPKYDSPT